MSENFDDEMDEDEKLAFDFLMAAVNILRGTGLRVSTITVDWDDEEEFLLDVTGEESTIH